MAAIVKFAQAANWPQRLDAQVVAVVSNKANAKGLAWAREHGLATAVVDHTAHASREAFDAALMAEIDRLGAVGAPPRPSAQPGARMNSPLAPQPAWVVLAGFMRILTPGFVAHYAGRLVNIHPSLLPAFTGLHTHQRALDMGCQVVGATVHRVTAELDHGDILAQAVVPVLPGDTADSLAARVLTQEHLVYPRAIERLLATG